MKAFIMKVDTAQSIDTVVLANTDEQQVQRTSQTRPHTAEHVVVNYLPVDRGHLPRTINHEGRNAE